MHHPSIFALRQVSLHPLQGRCSHDFSVCLNALAVPVKRAAAVAHNLMQDETG